MLFKVSSFIQLVQSWWQREFVYLVCLGIKKSVNAARSLLNKIFSPELHSAPLKVQQVILESWLLSLIKNWHFVLAAGPTYPKASVSAQLWIRLNHPLSYMGRLLRWEDGRVFATQQPCFKQVWPQRPQVAAPWHYMWADWCNVPGHRLTSSYQLLPGTNILNNF